MKDGRGTRKWVERQARPLLGGGISHVVREQEEAVAGVEQVDAPVAGRSVHAQVGDVGVAGEKLG